MHSGRIVKGKEKQRIQGALMIHFSIVFVDFMKIGFFYLCKKEDAMVFLENGNFTLNCEIYEIVYLLLLIIHVFYYKKC